MNHCGGRSQAGVAPARALQATAKASMNDVNEAQGDRLLHAVERLIEDPEDLIARVEELKEQARVPAGAAGVGRSGIVAQHIIERYSLRSATTGALTALPASAPGPGMLAAAIGGTFLDIGLMLKHETEMVLSLSYLHGNDIRDPHERRLAFLLAAAGSYEALTGGDNFLMDVAAAEVEAIWHYTPRQVTKLLTILLSRLVLRAASRRLVKMVPIVGVAVSSTINKVCTKRVGRSSNAALVRRRRADSATPRPRENDVVDAWFKD
ncbi:MAG: EcsC family protein [Polyangiaceae bacterium]|jgi:hypothetical protein|nr:EcsC family protein [Polyangiaceae bacterium]